MSDFRSIFRISIADMAHEFGPSLLAVFGLAGILAPLLILFSLKYGVMAAMSEKLLAAPKYRMITPKYHGAYQPAWFTDMEAHPDVQFITPDIHFLSKSVVLVNPADQSSIILGMNPTAAGDPVLTRYHLAVNGNNETVLTFYAALELNLIDPKTRQPLPAVMAGKARLEVEIINEKAGIRVVHPMRVTGIIPEADSDKTENFMYASLAFASAVEDLIERPEQERDFDILLSRDIGQRPQSGFRLYAKELKGVLNLVDGLERQDIAVNSKAIRVREMMQIDKVLMLVFTVVAGIGALGFLMANTVHLMANVARKQRELSILRLLGYSSRAVALFPTVQAVLTAIMGSLLALVVYFLIAPLIEMRFKADIHSLFGYRLGPDMGVDLMQLYPEHFFIAMGMTIAVASFASIAAGLRAARMLPAEGIRYE